MENTENQTQSSGVKSLATMFEQQLSPRSRSQHTQRSSKERFNSHDTKPEFNLATRPPDVSSNEYVASHIEPAVNTATVLSETSLSIKEGLAMFGNISPIKDGASLTVRHRIMKQANKVELPPPPERIMKPKTNVRKHSIEERLPVTPITPPHDLASRQVDRDNLNNETFQRRMSIEQSHAIELPPPPSRITKRHLLEGSQSVTELALEEQNKLSSNSMFTPMKSKEPLAAERKDKMHIPPAPPGDFSIRYLRYPTRSKTPKAATMIDEVHEEANAPINENTSIDIQESQSQRHQLTTSQVSTPCIDEATIKQRREALLHGLKRHLREKHATDACEDTPGPTDRFPQVSEKDFLDFLHNQTTASSHVVGNASILLRDTTERLSPVHESAKEPKSTRSVRPDDGDESPISSWVLPIANHFEDRKKKRHTLCSKVRAVCPTCCHQSIACATNTSAKWATMHLASFLRFIYSSCRSFIVGCMASLSFFAFIIIKTCQSLLLRIQNHVNECLFNWSTMLHLSPSGAKVLLEWMTAMDNGSAACLASFHVSVVAEISTVAPRYNCALAFMLFCLQVKPVESKRQTILLVIIVLLSICFDVDWLSSKYVPDPLESEGNVDIFAYRLEKEESIVQSFAWYGVLINVFMKTISLDISLRSSKRGNLMREMFWGRIKFLCTLTNPSDDVEKAIRGKIVTILWIELVSSVICFASFFIIDCKGVSSALFQDGPMQVLSLQATLLYKGTSGVFVVLSLVHDVRLRGVCTQFGCTSCCPSLNKEHLGHEWIAYSLGKSMKCFLTTKLIDFVVGVFVWTNLSSAQKEFTRDVPKDTIFLFSLLVSTQIMTCIFASLLGTVAVWWVYLSKKRSFRESLRHRAASDNTATVHNKNREVTSDDDSSKRSNRQLQSRGKLKRLTSSGLKQQKTAKQNDKEYDFSTNNVSTSQSLFESRLDAASAPTLHSSVHTSSTSCDTLDLDILCSPREFRSQWAKLSRGTLISCKVEKTIPSLSECHKYYQPRRFYVIASGVVAHETKLFLVAQRRVKPMNRNPRSHSKELVTRCLCEVTFDSKNMELNAEVRCSDNTQIPFFVGALNLKEFI